MLNTNINTIVVQTIQALAVLAITLENAYPVPALAFAQTLDPTPLYFSVQGIQIGSTLKLTATAYTSISSLTDGSPNITATGAQTTYGIIASNVFPLGTKIRINNTIFTVQDRMSTRYDDKLWVDIWMPTLEEAQAFGVRTVYGTIQSLPE